MRFAKGTKVKIVWIRRNGQHGFVVRWWNQVEAFIARQREAGATNFMVKGQGWKDWRRVK